MLDIAGPRLTVRPAAGLPLLHLDEAILSRPQAFAKRSLDLIGALALSLLLLPVFLACAIAVRLSSKGPVLFRQPRIGSGGRPFTMIKFRTMVEGADAMRADLREQTGGHESMFKMANDPRVTRVGRFLRRWSLDELPQLWNVIGGSMSLVGPRPHPLDDVDRYELDAYRRLALKPGLTGLWQVEGRSDLTWQEALQFDLYYVETWTLSGDLVLLARTVRAVLQGRGASHEDRPRPQLLLLGRSQRENAIVLEQADASPGGARGAPRFAHGRTMTSDAAPLLAFAPRARPDRPRDRIPPRNCGRSHPTSSTSTTCFPTSAPGGCARGPVRSSPPSTTSGPVRERTAVPRWPPLRRVPHRLDWLAPCGTAATTAPRLRRFRWRSETPAD